MKTPNIIERYYVSLRVLGTLHIWAPLLFIAVYEVDIINVHVL